MYKYAVYFYCSTDFQLIKNDLLGPDAVKCTLTLFLMFYQALPVELNIHSPTFPLNYAEISF